MYNDTSRTVSDETLFFQVQQGNEGAFEALFLRHYPALCAYARLFVEPDDGQEIVSDVMVWLWENKEMQAFENSLKSYLFKAVKNRCLTLINRNEVKQRIEKMIFDNLQSQYDDPDFYVIQELTEKIEEALARLPENVREAFELNRFQNLTYNEIAERLDTEGGFTGWDDEIGAGSAEETLEQALAEERLAELESELEQDEHPIDYEAELESEEEESAPVSEKRLKREIRAEAMRRLEEAARTEKDFRAVVEEWNKLDRNRERRERDHENLRGDVPLEYQAVPEPKLIPRWMNNPAYRQLMAGNFLDILFDCPYEMHNLTADAFISRIVEELSEEHKEVLYFLSLRLYSTNRLADVRGQSDRNIRKLRKTIHKKLQRQMYDHLCGKQEHGGSLTLRERQFLEEFSKIARKQGKDAVIRRENKTKRRKKKNRP